ncbi:MAG: ABC transporter permease subunit [Eubacteriales bacterium]
MNILKRELRTILKPFIFWTIGLFILVFAGMTKYTGVANAPGELNLNDLLVKFPRVFLAVMGMADADLGSLGGYYSVLVFYALICTVIFAIHLGNNAVSRESIDKTYEFIFTKPRLRSYVLRMKLITAWFYLIIFSIFHYIFSVSAVQALGFSENINFEMLLFSLMLFLTGSIFLALSAFISATVKNAEKGAMYGNLCFMFAFIMGIIYDILESGFVIKLFSPLRYFSTADLLDKKLDPVFVFICITITAVFLTGAFIKFNKRDLT